MKVLKFGLVLMILICMMLSGCSCNNGKVDWDQIGTAVFDEVIKITILAVETEIEDGKEGNVDYIMKWMEGWMINLKGTEYLDKYIPDWKDKLKQIIGNAYDAVIDHGHELLESKLSKPEYEGADPIMHKVLEPDDFRIYYDEIMAPLH